MLDLFKGATRPALLLTTLKVGAAVAILSVLATHWLSAGGLDRTALARLASDVARGLEDPATTGSLARAAGSTRLDPCVAPSR